MLNDILGSSSVPSTHSVRLTVTYFSVFEGDPPPPPTIHTKDIVIAKADGVRKAGGFDMETDLDSTVQLEYQVRSGNHDCGPAIVDTAQERLTNRTHLGLPLPGSVGWMPAAASPTFYLQGSIIANTHSLGTVPEAVWDSLKKDDSIDTATQELRIVWTDPCNVTYFGQTLGSVDIVHKKASAATWKVEGTIVP